MTAQISHSVVVAGAPGSALGPHNAWQTVVSGGNAEQPAQGRSDPPTVSPGQRIGWNCYRSGLLQRL